MYTEHGECIEHDVVHTKYSFNLFFGLVPIVVFVGSTATSHTRWHSGHRTELTLFYVYKFSKTVG